MKVVIINGRGGAGKDAFVDMCKKYVPCTRYSSVSRVKRAAELLGWTGGKGLADRKFLSDLKDLVTWYNDAPFEDLKFMYEKASKPHVRTKILFFHVREPREIERCVKEFNAKTLLIRRPSDSNDKYGNHADDDVEKFDYNYIIENDAGLEELASKARQFVEDILGEKAD